MGAILVTFVLLGALVLAVREAYGGSSDAVRQALRDALDRGEMRPEEYAAHLRALEHAT